MQNMVFKALSHPDRRKILSLLREGPQKAGDLAEKFEASWPTISRHLSVLKEAELVTVERQGNVILYRINTTVLEDAAGALLSLINHNKGDIS